MILGAWSSHGLKPFISQRMYDSFQTGLEYQAVHSLALLAVGLLMKHADSRLLRISGIFTVTGITLFSFSLYLYAGFGFPVSFLTPFGGISFIAGWILLFAAAIRIKN